MSFKNLPWTKEYINQLLKCVLEKQTKGIVFALKKGANQTEKYKRIIKEGLNRVPNNWAIGLQEERGHREPTASSKTYWMKQDFRHLGLDSHSCLWTHVIDHGPLCSAPGDFSLGLFSQESEISEHVKEPQLSDSTASDPKSFLGLVSLR